MPERFGIRTSSSTTSGAVRSARCGALDAVTGLADHLDAGLDGEQHGQAAAEQLLVVDHEHPDRLALAVDRRVGHAGIMARTDPGWRTLGRHPDGEGGPIGPPSHGRTPVSGAARQSSSQVERDHAVVVAAPAVDDRRLARSPCRRTGRSRGRPAPSRRAPGRASSASAGWVFSRTTSGPSPVTVDRADLALGGRRRRPRPSGRPWSRLLGERLADRDRAVPAVVHPAAVGGAAHLRGHLVERQVERGHLVLGGGLGPDHGSLGERGQLDAYGAVGLARVAFRSRPRRAPG